MAKQSAGYMGGFSGRLGPAVGYMWRGVWCVRSHQPVVHNPRTPAQTAHREMFKREVQLAAAMRWAVNLGFRELSYELHMTPYNLFVHLNQGAFSLVDGAFTVDYSRLSLSSGPLAGVAFHRPEWTADNVLTVAFDKDDGSGLKASAYDSVYLYVYCPDLEVGFMAAPVYRRTKRVSVALPDGFAGREVHLYGMVSGGDGLWSETVYGGAIVLTENGEVPELSYSSTVTYSSTTAERRSPSPVSGEEPKLYHLQKGRDKNYQNSSLILGEELENARGNDIAQSERFKLREHT